MADTSPHRFFVDAAAKVEAGAAGASGKPGVAHKGPNELFVNAAGVTPWEHDSKLSFDENMKQMNHDISSKQRKDLLTRWAEGNKKRRNPQSTPVKVPNSGEGLKEDIGALLVDVDEGPGFPVPVFAVETARNTPELDQQRRERDEKRTVQASDYSTALQPKRDKKRAEQASHSSTARKSQRQEKIFTLESISARDEEQACSVCKKQKHVTNIFVDGSGYNCYKQLCSDCEQGLTDKYEYECETCKKSCDIPNCLYLYQKNWKSFTEEDNTWASILKRSPHIEHISLQGVDFCDFCAVLPRLQSAETLARNEKIRERYQEISCSWRERTVARRLRSQPSSRPPDTAKVAEFGAMAENNNDFRAGLCSTQVQQDVIRGYLSGARGVVTSCLRAFLLLKNRVKPPDTKCSHPATTRTAHIHTQPSLNPCRRLSRIPS
jgi:hypothetical protein